MVRAKYARQDSSEDIPVARRSGASRSPVVAFFCFVIVCLIGVIIFRLLIPVKRSNSLISGNGRTSESVVDSRLLGHFPYLEISEEDLVTLPSGIRMHQETAKSYRAMRSAAWPEGIDIRLLSGFRSHDLQEEIFFEIKSERNQTALERAKVSAPPGYSEHGTGYAIDLGDGTRPDTHFEEEFESTKAFIWLKNNAARYHFVLSFPLGNLQGVSYEPWHWRFEGTAAALRQFEEARNRFR